MNSVKTIFGIEGRISRGTFWINTILIWCAMFAVQAVLSGAGIAMLALAGMLGLAALTSQCIKRLHDRGYSAAWLFVVLLPVAGAIWLVWQLACRAGQASENSWGIAEKSVQKNFLVVQS